LLKAFDKLFGLDIPNVIKYKSDDKIKRFHSYSKANYNILFAAKFKYRITAYDLNRKHSKIV